MDILLREQVGPGSRLSASLIILQLFDSRHTIFSDIFDTPLRPPQQSEHISVIQHKNHPFSVLHIVSDMQQIPLQFTGIINGYRVIVLAVKNSLQFRYQHPDHQDIYEAVFFKQILSSTNPEAARQILISFSNSFKRCLKYIQDYHEDQQRIQILAGQVSLWHYITKLRPKKIIPIRFDGKKMLTHQQTKAEKKVQSDVIDVKAQNAFLKETMNRLQLECQNQIKQIQQLRQLVLLKKKKYLKYIKDDTKMLSAETSRNTTVHRLSSIAQVATSLNQLKSTLKGLIKRVEQQEVMMPELTEEEQDQERLEKYGMRHWVTVDLNNRFISQYFEIEDNVVKRIGKQYFTAQILGRNPIPFKGRHYFSIYLNRISWSIFSVGIASQSRRNHKVSYDNPDCISFYGRDGTVWSNGVCMGGGSHVPDNVEIIVVVDRIKNLVKWYQEGVEVASTVLEVQFRRPQVRIVPCIHLTYAGDQITFNERPNLNAKQQ